MQYQIREFLKNKFFLKQKYASHLKDKKGNDEYLVHCPTNAGKGTDVNGIRHSINKESLEMTCIVPSRWFLDSLEFEMKGGEGDYTVK